MKNKFFKNLYQSIFCFLSVLLVVVLLLCGYIQSLKLEYKNYGWVLLVISIFLIFLYFFVGFYWIFQKVEFDFEEIKITLFNKVLRKIKWSDIENIKRTNVMRNPSYTFEINKGKDLNLDGRKKIKQAIEYFGKQTIN